MSNHQLSAPDKPLPPGATLRGWLDHLQSTQRLTLVEAGTPLRFGVAAVANRLDGQSASLFLAPDQHEIPVVSGLLSDRLWMAEAMGVKPAEVLNRFQEASLNPIAGEEVADAP